MGIAADERTEPRQKLSLWTGKRKHDKGAVYHRRVDAAMQVKALTTAEREEINKPMKRYGNLINEIIDRSNLEASFDEVTCDLSKWSKEYYRSKKEEIINRLATTIGNGSFRITRFEEFEVKDGNKIRKVQSPPVVERIGCNAVMRVVERYVYPTVIPTSCASIKGRGMHKLFRKMRSDIRHNMEDCCYYFQSDFRKFYESICQILMKQLIRRYIKDKVLLPILDNFIELMPKGLSIGLRSSQCFGNLLLSELDHRMKEKYGARFYYRYCDDILILAKTKKRLWWLREKLHAEAEALGLEIKPSEAIRPLSEGIDFLGFVYDGDKARIRKRTKQRFARHMAKVKSRSRRRKLIGSFYGMAKWGNCRHLMQTIIDKRKDMEEFKNLGLVYQPEDGKKQFVGERVKLGTLVNLHIVILDFEEDVPTENGNRTLVQFQFDNGTKAKYFTSDKRQLQFLRLAKERKVLPFGTTIGMESFGKGVRYTFN